VILVEEKMSQFSPLHSAWFEELFRRWQTARGRRTQPAARPFRVSWPELLGASGISSAEDEAAALREAEALEREGRLTLKRHRFRKYLVERISIPLEAEGWLRDGFDAPDAGELRDQSLAAVAAAPEHPLWPEEWDNLRVALRAAFANSRSLRPFVWHQPANVRFLLEALHGITAREWDPGTPLRTASAILGFDSKKLERHRRSVESALALLFGAQTLFSDLGLVTSESMLHVHGRIVLGFASETQRFDGLDASYQLSFADLERADHVESEAVRLLTVENLATFRHLAAANPGDTLLVTSSFPTPALLELLRKLPPEMPHFHFGDTDPSGWLILRKLREVSPKVVLPFLMKWRSAARSSPLTARDHALLDSLLAAPEMTDVREEIEATVVSNDRGDFEQESLGPPDVRGWPFYSTSA
jgi:hypothetical protein